MDLPCPQKDILSFVSYLKSKNMFSKSKQKKFKRNKTFIVIIGLSSIQMSANNSLCSTMEPTPPTILFFHLSHLLGTRASDICIFILSSTLHIMMLACMFIHIFAGLSLLAISTHMTHS